MLDTESNPEKSLLSPRKKVSSFPIDTLKIVSGTLFTQLIGFAATPLLTRLFAPNDFGISVLYSSIISTLAVIACLRYELSIMIPDNDEEAVNMLGVSIITSILISLVSIPILFLWQKPLLNWLNASELQPYIWLIPLMTLISGIFNALHYWNTRTKRFGRLSIARIVQSFVNTSSSLGAGYAGYASGGTLISADVFSQAFSVIVLGAQIWRDDSKLFINSIKWKDMIAGGKRYRKFPIYGTLAAFLNTFSWQLPVFLLSNYFSSTIVGYYSLGFRILKIPMGLIGNAISQVFFQRASEAKANGSLKGLVENAFSILVKFSLYPSLLITIIGRDLFAVVFGSGWAEAGVYAQILGIYSFFWFISTPLSNITNVLEKQQFGTIWNIGLFLSRLFSLGIGGYFRNVYLSLGLFSVTGIILYITLFVIQFGWLGIGKNKLIKYILTEFIISLTLLTPVLLIKFLNVNKLFLYVSVLMSALLYGIYLYKQNESYIQKIIHKKVKNSK